MQMKRSFWAQLASSLQLSLSAVLILSTAAPRVALADTSDPLKTQAPSASWPFYYTSEAPYKVRVVHDGLSALELRLRMIARAQKKIDIMVYLFGTDKSGELVLHALMKRALEGVKIRVLLDFYNDNGKPDINEETIEAVRQKLVERAGPGGLKGSIEFRYYNRGSLLGNPIKMNHRNHAKLFNVDDREIMVGGRNIGDDYFSLENEGVSYLDRDAYVLVPPNAPANNVGYQARDAFDAFWSSPWVSASQPWDSANELTDDAVWTAQPDEAVDINAENDLRKQVAQASLPILGTEAQELYGTKAMPTFQTKRVSFVIDRPGHSHEDRLTTYVANSNILKARRYLILENYTCASTTQHQKLLLKVANELMAPVVLLTNGFETSDNGTLTRFEYAVEKNLLKASRNLWTLDMTGKFEPGQALLAAFSHPKVMATHSKTTVIYDENSATTMIGSYNFDGRSELYNNEDLLIFENDPYIAQETASGVIGRTQVARQLMIGAKGKLQYTDGTQIPSTKRSFVEKLVRVLGLSKLMRSLY